MVVLFIQKIYMSQFERIIFVTAIINYSNIIIFTNSSQASRQRKITLHNQLCDVSRSCKTVFYIELSWLNQILRLLLVFILG